ncbi:oxidoreductase [Corynebacterium sp. CNJ-954]|nr:oxidoreductase [Corynebacterium sp. CNJ-954]
MKAATVVSYGGPEVLTVCDVSMPRPGPDEALVAVVASTVNPVDVKFRVPGTSQVISQFPASLGWDLAGVVVTAPVGSGWVSGDRVIAMYPPQADGTGCWQRYIALPAGLLAPAPESVDLSTAASLPLTALTADQALEKLDLRQGERLLVTGAAGGVGGMAIQLVSRADVEVVGLVRDPGHGWAVLDLGADTVASDPAGIGSFDAVLDTAGVFTYPHVLREGGRLVTVSDDVIPEQLAHRASSAMHNYVSHDPRRLRELSTLVDAGELQLRVAARYPLHAIRKAHHHVEGGGLVGKVVITM